MPELFMYGSEKEYKSYSSAENELSSAVLTQDEAKVKELLNIRAKGLPVCGLNAEGSCDIFHALAYSDTTILELLIKHKIGNNDQITNTDYTVDKLFAKAEYNSNAHAKVILERALEHPSQEIIYDFKRSKI